MDKIENFRLELLEFLKNRYKLKKGGIQSEISNLDFYFSNELTEFNSTLYEPSICIILQGSKAVSFADELYSYSSEDYLLSSSHFPACVKLLEASEETPYISFRIRFDMQDIYDVIKKIDTQKLILNAKTEKALYFDKLNENLYEPIVRLIKLLNRPKEDIEFLTPIMTKEILYVLINERSGYFLNKFALEGTVSNKIAKIISEIKNNYNEKLNIKELAKIVDMSESSLYKNFKIITSLSPLQLQKKIRLEEAKLMLVNQNVEVAEVAFNVGYESASQFSREYLRMFGMSPKAHAEFLKSN